MTMSRKRIYLSIDGNIGSGKTTLLNNLRGVFTKIQEPVGLYKSYVSLEGHKFDPLMEMYSNPVREAPLAQMHIVNTSKKYYRSQLLSSPFQMCVSERSLFSPEVFIRAKREAGQLSKFSEQFLLAHLEKAKRSSRKYLPNFIIYLRCDPEISLQRVQNRNKAADECITEQYLAVLHEEYDKFFCGGRIGDTQVFNVDVSNLSPFEILPVVYQVFDRIVEKVCEQQQECIQIVRNAAESCLSVVPEEEEGEAEEEEEEEGELRGEDGTEMQL